MLNLTHLRKTFGSLTAVADLSLEIHPGEIFGLLGPNGAGKTTTVNLAVGLLIPDAGKVVIQNDRSPQDPSTRALIGVAPQALALYDDLSGEENLVFFGKLQGLAGKKLKDRTDWSLNFVQLSDRRRDRIKAYSGGMKRRLNLAIALIHDPPLLLLDEPTVGVDPQSRNAIFDNIIALRREGRAILYTTHYMEEAQRLCDRVAIMDQGKLLALDTVDNLIKAQGGKDVLIIESNGAEIRLETDNPLGELAKYHDRGKPPRFRLERPTLENVFLNLTGRHLRD